MNDEGTTPDDSPPPPFRPWGASGVDQPAADRPAGTNEPRGAMTPYPETAYAVPRSGPPRPGTYPAPVAASPPGRRAFSVANVGLSVGLAVVAAATAWLPWLKSPSAGLFSLAGTGSERSIDGWDVPARFLWSYRTSSSGFELGWIIVGLAALTLVLGLIPDARARAFARVAAGLEALVALLYLIQVARLVDATPFSAVADIGITDFAGIGVYVLLVVGVVRIVVPRD